MSWFQKNYEKVALGGAVMVAIGLAYSGWSKLGNVPVDFSTGLTGGGKNNTAVKNADLIEKAIASLKIDRTWSKGLLGERPVDLFTGIALFVSSSAPEEQIDLIKDAPVHEPIPNTWWIENRLDPGFADSPARDPDSDGYSNMEEFNSKTDPNDAKSVPPFISKLLFIKDESVGWVLRPSYGDNGSFPFKYEDTKGRTNSAGAGDMVPPNGLFFKKGYAANRFKLLGSEVRSEQNKSINIPMDVTIVRIEDQRANKKGIIYEIPSPLSDQRKNEHVKYDRTAVFSLEALGMNGKEFKVEENTEFALPPGNSKKDYKVKAVTENSVVVEYPDAAGNRKEITLTKGSLPQMNP